MPATIDYMAEKERKKDGGREGGSEAREQGVKKGERELRGGWIKGGKEGESEEGRES